MNNCVIMLITEKTTVSCAPTEFMCVTSKRCLDNKFVCDNHDDCGDMSDEKNCNGKLFLHQTYQISYMLGVMIVISILCAIQSRRNLWGVPMSGVL